MNKKNTSSEDLYAYPTIEDYEEIIGLKVNEIFKMGWMMARTTNEMIDSLAKSHDEREGQ